MFSKNFFFPPLGQTLSVLDTQTIQAVQLIFVICCPCEIPVIRSSFSTMDCPEKDCFIVYWLPRSAIYISSSSNSCEQWIANKQISLRKTVGKVSPILITLTSRNDSDFERSNVSLKENKSDEVNSNSDDIDH